MALTSVPTLRYSLPMFEVRFEETSGARWRVGWWVATAGAGLIVGGLGGALLGPLASPGSSDGVVYFGIGVTAATVGFVAFILGRNLMLRRIVTMVAEDGDDHDAHHDQH